MFLEDCRLQPGSYDATPGTLDVVVSEEDIPLQRVKDHYRIDFLLREHLVNNF